MTDWRRTRKPSESRRTSCHKTASAAVGFWRERLAKSNFSGRQRLRKVLGLLTKTSKNHQFRNGGDVFSLEVWNLSFLRGTIPQRAFDAGSARAQRGFGARAAQGSKQRGCSRVSLLLACVPQPLWADECAW